jgi:hypothetical protein
MMRKASSFDKTLLRKSGYSEQVIEEIYRWYSCPGTNN